MYLTPVIPSYSIPVIPDPSYSVILTPVIASYLKSKTKLPHHPLITKAILKEAGKEAGVRSLTNGSDFD
ncbi:hypothetical protein AU255_07935 [Methyloprofundus sedimenti]|uniref:Uncharacterized protein n=1 Tax=Methyloprofundus sedimenti TaxID=1420851 RepID=A0A1V8M876_9GAMM|nr:hypothetical protein AU255_07935 [Methyloprofundus sedimenti]